MIHVHAFVGYEPRMMLTDYIYVASVLQMF